jgi:hypothetical protein
VHRDAVGRSPRCGFPRRVASNVAWWAAS